MIQVSPDILSEVIGGFYEAAHDPEAWPAAIERLRQIFHGSTACFARVGPSLTEYDSISANNDPAYRELFVRDFGLEKNILTSAVSALPVGAIYSDEKLVGRRRLRQSRFWNDWMAPQDMYGGLACKLIETGSSIWFVDVQRGRNQPAFDENEVELIGFLAPHLRRAAEVSRKFWKTRALAATFSHLPFGIIFVDGHLNILMANAVAEDILARPQGMLRRRSGTLVTEDTRGGALLRQFVVDAGSAGDRGGIGGDFMLGREDAGSSPGIAVSVSPFRTSEIEGRLIEPCAVVALREMTFDLPRGLPEQARRLFDLTSRETQLAVSLAAGRTLREAAEAGNIRFSTARSYLEEIFAKTGTRQQSQLVALLKSLQPFRS
jgi:DNA-binding CsgD family transcriptional regulator